MSLKLGDAGPEVLALKQRLNALPESLGIPRISLTDRDGDGRFEAGEGLNAQFDAQTKRAVEALQRLAASRGLMNASDIIGIFGPKSENALGIIESYERVEPVRPINLTTIATRIPRSGITAGNLDGSTIPEASPDKEGRYRLVTVNGDPVRGSRSNAVNSEMVLLNPQGEAVWRGRMVSGGWGKGALPGMDPSTYRGDFSDNPIIAEYTLHPGERRSIRTNRSFSYANGQDGYFFYLENPDRSTMRQLGGDGRGEFGIHPGGERITRTGGMAASAGCMKMIDDASARSFWNIMNDLPANQRPVSLEIVNRDFVRPRARDLGLQVAEARPTISRVEYRAETPENPFQPVLNVLARLTGLNLS